MERLSPDLQCKETLSPLAPSPKPTTTVPRIRGEVGPLSLEPERKGLSGKRPLQCVSGNCPDAPCNRGPKQTVSFLPWEDALQCASRLGNVKDNVCRCLNELMTQRGVSTLKSVLLSEILKWLHIDPNKDLLGSGTSKEAYRLPERFLSIPSAEDMAIVFPFVRSREGSTYLDCEDDNTAKECLVSTACSKKLGLDGFLPSAHGNGGSDNEGFQFLLMPRGTEIGELSQEQVLHLTKNGFAEAFWVMMEKLGTRILIGDLKPKNMVLFKGYLAFIDLSSAVSHEIPPLDMGIAEDLKIFPKTGTYPKPMVKKVPEEGVGVKLLMEQYKPLETWPFLAFLCEFIEILMRLEPEAEHDDLAIPSWKELKFFSDACCYVLQMHRLASSEPGPWYGTTKMERVVMECLSKEEDRDVKVFMWLLGEPPEDADEKYRRMWKEKICDFLPGGTGLGKGALAAVRQKIERQLHDARKRQMKSTTKLEKSDQGTSPCSKATQEEAAEQCDGRVERLFAALQCVTVAEKHMVW